MTDDFGRLQSVVAEGAENFRGFVEQSVIPPTPGAAELGYLTTVFKSEGRVSWLLSPVRHAISDQTTPLTAHHPSTFIVKDPTRDRPVDGHGRHRNTCQE